MDRSLIQMKRSQSGTLSSRRIGTTMKQQTTPPQYGTVVECPHRRLIQMNAGGHGAREQKDPRAVASHARRFAPCHADRRPDGTGLHAANDAGRRRDSEPAVAAAVRQPGALHPRPTRSSMT